MTARIQPRLAVQQRVMPSYRVPFFDALAGACANGLSVFFGDPRKGEGIESGVRPGIAAYFHGKNVHLFHGLFYACWQGRLLRWLKEWGPEVLVMEANLRYLRSRAAVRWMKRRGGKVIGWGLGSPRPVGRLADLRMALRRRFVSQFDALLTYSRQGAEEYVSLGFPVERIFPAPNAVAPKPARPMPERPPRYIGGKPVVLFVGRLQSRKRGDALIRACAMLPSALRPELRLVGDGPQMAELKALAASVYPQACFFGAQHGADLERHFLEADLFVLPGTGGLAVQEAMSYGLPVVVGVADGTQVDLVRRENGWMLPDDSEEALARLLENALGDIPRLRMMGTASYRIVSREINLEAMVAAFARAVQAVVED